MGRFFFRREFQILFLEERTLKKKDIWFKNTRRISADHTLGMNITGMYIASSTALISKHSQSVCPLYSIGIEACGQAARIMLVNGKKKAGQVAGADLSRAKCFRNNGGALLQVCFNRHFVHCYVQDSIFSLNCANLPTAGYHHLGFHQQSI